MTLDDAINSEAEYKARATMKSYVKAQVFRKMSTSLGGQAWYEANKEYVRRLVWDACEKYSIPTKSETQIEKIADTVIEQIRAKISWDAL